MFTLFLRSMQLSHENLPSIVECKLFVISRVILPIIGDMEIILPVIFAKARAVEKGKDFSTSSMEQIKEKIFLGAKKESYLLC